MRRTRNFALTTLVSMAALIAAAFAAAPVQAVLVHDFTFAGSGSTGGKLSNPSGIAVNHATGDVYLADRGNNRIVQFSAAGGFIRTWGYDVVTAGKPNDEGISFEICDTTAGNAPADCKAGIPQEAAGGFDFANSLAIDNSSGPAAGSVYVGDIANLRIQRFEPDGDFVLMWGKGVNQTSGGDLCPRQGFPADVCQKGEPVSAPPGFSGAFTGGWRNNGTFQNRIAVDGDGNVYASSVWLAKYDSTGSLLGKIVGELGADPYLFHSEITADADGNVYQAGGDFDIPVAKLPPSEFTESGLTSGFDRRFPHQGEGVLHVAIDPVNQYLFVVDFLHPSPCQTTTGGRYFGDTGSKEADHVVEYGPDGELADCTPQTTPGMELLNRDDMGGIAISPTHKLYMIVNSEIRVFDIPVASPPAVNSQAARSITTNSARLEASVSANLAATTFRVEYGTSPCSELPNPCASTAELPAGTSVLPKARSTQLAGLIPDTDYFYRFAVTSGEGVDIGPDRRFRTFPEPVFTESCPNNLARQQTGAALLLDCRAYELVSAPDQGGYNVASTLIAGQEPFGGYPQADDRALYAIHNGGVPGTGKPTNRGPDPYVADRDAENQRWNTRYVGVPADAPSLAAFSSTLAGADAGLDAFAFAGPDICDPCFPDGSAGIPIRTPGGQIVQGMVGSMPVPLPTPAGGAEKHFSADGSHFIFSSEQQFEPAGNPDDGNVTIYDRDLETNVTQVVSTTPGGLAIANGADVVALDVSADGSRVLIGNRASTDTEGNDYYDLYMHDGTSADSIEIVDNTGGVLYAGMSADGTKVYFTTRDDLALGDNDLSVDLYRADVDSSGATLSRVSTGEGGAGDTDLCNPAANSFNTEDWNAIPGGPTDCSVLAIAGGAGVASDSGSVYFLSPERLDGSGTDGAPNLFLAQLGEDPRFVATLESSLSKPLTAPIHPFLGSFGSFDNGEGVAIDTADKSTYVYDAGITFSEEAFGQPGPGAVVRKFDSTGNLDQGFGNGGVLDGSNTPSGSFGALGVPLGEFPIGVPTQVAVDNSAGPSAGSLYVSDLLEESIKKFDSDGQFISEITSGVSDVLALAVSPVSGNLYVGQKIPAGARVRVFNPAGTQLKSATLTGAGTVLGLAIDSANRLYVAGETSTRIYDANNPTPGNPSLAFLSTLYTGTSYGVAVDPVDNHVYVDTGSSIVEFSAPGSPVVPSFGEDVLSGKSELYEAGSVGLAVDAGIVKASNLGDRSIAVFGPRAVQPDRGFDHPLVVNSAGEPSTRRSADFQVTPDGEYAAFATTLPLEGFDAAGHYEVFRYDAANDLRECASCTTTGQAPVSDATMAPDGLSLIDDGRLFFDTEDPLSLRDLNNEVDVYEWSPQRSASLVGACLRPDGCVELVSSGKDRTGGGLLSAGADGTDVFFFTRESLAANDTNGNVMKLYTAREGGGFFVVPPPPQCAASDECHGPGSEPPPPASLATLNGTGGNPKAPLRCKKNQMKRGGKCVPRKKRQQKRANRRGHARQGKGR